MKTATKVLIIACCLAFCCGATLFLPQEATKNPAPKTQFAPVNNRQPQRTTWIRV